MPNYRGVEVRVTSQKGVPLEEFGKQVLNKNRTISIFIESRTDFSFKIRLTPEHPFPLELSDVKVQPSINVESPPNQQPMKGSRIQSKQFAGKSQPLAGPEFSEFHLLASVYLDGREKPERRCVLYINPTHIHHSTTGSVWMDSRLVLSDDGKIRSHKWVFKDMGIETILDRLFISGELPVGEFGSVEEDALITAMNSACLEESEESGPDAGTIKVVLQRIMVGTPYRDRHFKPLHKENEEDDLNIGASSDCSHLAKTSKESETYSVKGASVIRYHLCNEDEAPWAIFKFLYRSKDILSRFPFFKANEHKHQSSLFTRRKHDLNQNLAFLTPLSISTRTSSTETTRQRREKSCSNRDSVDNRLRQSSSTTLEARPEKEKTRTEWSFKRSTSSRGAHYEHTTKEVKKVQSRGRVSKSDDLVGSGQYAPKQSFISQSKLLETESILSQPLSFFQASSSHSVVSASDNHRSSSLVLSRSQTIGKDSKEERTSTDEKFKITRESQDSDADDERESKRHSQLSTGRESICSTSSDDHSSCFDLRTNLNADDSGLSERIQSITLGKRSRGDDDEEFAQNKTDLSKKSKKDDFMSSKSSGNDSINLDIDTKGQGKERAALHAARKDEA